MSRLMAVLMGICLALGTVSGCGPKLNDEDLGELQTRAEELPGAGEKYPLPEPVLSEDEEPQDDDQGQQGEH